MGDPSQGLAELGWDDEWERTRIATGGVGRRARVVRHDGVKVLVADGSDRMHATFPRSMSLAVGDWVLVDSETVLELLPRRTELARDLGEHGSQVVGANIDRVLVVFGVDRPLRRAKVLRFVAFAWDVGAEPVIVLSKCDLTDDLPSLISAIRTWDIEVPVVHVSTEQGIGLDRLRDLIRGRTATLIGESGAGKSSLVNALMGDEIAWTGEVRSSDRRGRHTTTHRELHVLPGGGVLIDNPGVRSLGLAPESSGLDDAFSDVDEVAHGCRFRDCRHGGEPGCAVAEAVESGDLDADRVEQYRRLADERAATGARVEEAQRRADRRADRRTGDPS